jgi:hypothetical protein
VHPQLIDELHSWGHNSAHDHHDGDDEWHTLHGPDMNAHPLDFISPTDASGKSKTAAVPAAEEGHKSAKRGSIIPCVRYLKNLEGISKVSAPFSRLPSSPHTHANTMCTHCPPFSL